MEALCSGRIAAREGFSGQERDYISPMSNQNTEQDESPRRVISVMGREFVMTRSRKKRVAIGFGLTILGCFGFLPILGFWMIPLGLLVLSYEFALVRRYRRRGIVRWGRWRQRRNGGGRNGDS